MACIPLFHGTKTLEAALSILVHGIRYQLMKTDGGYFGAGYYFTPNLRLAQRYARPDGLGFVVMCAVRTGNVYPVVEHPDRRKPKALGQAGPPLRKQPTVRGFDTHVIWVQDPDPVSAEVVKDQDPGSGGR